MHFRAGIYPTLALQWVNNTHIHFISDKKKWIMGAKNLLSKWNFDDEFDQFLNGDEWLVISSKLMVYIFWPVIVYG